MVVYIDNEYIYDGFYQPVVVTNNGEIIHIKA